MVYGFVLKMVSFGWRVALLGDPLELFLGVISFDHTANPREAHPIHSVILRRKKNIY